MKDYIPPGYLSLSDALDLVGRHLFGAPAASGEGLPAQAIDWLRNLLAEEQVPAIAIAENGQRDKIGGAFWQSREAMSVFANGELPPGNLRQALQRKQEGTLHRRIHVSEADLEAGITRHTRPTHKGRPRGSGSLAVEDEPLVNEMCELIDEEKARSPHDAARQVAERASGGGTLDSKIRRLERRYSESLTKNER